MEHKRSPFKSSHAMSRCWMADIPKTDCTALIDAYYARLSEQKQACLRGGCTDLDCVANGQTCYT
ncbi:MAG: hypothetical protein L0Y36_08865, partial [Planctomycetales bacterium]|nr:hypothetical protein [Planctomycetales bacterium]